MSEAITCTTKKISCVWSCRTISLLYSLAKDMYKVAPSTVPMELSKMARPISVVTQSAFAPGRGWRNVNNFRSLRDCRAAFVACWTSLSSVCSTLTGMSLHKLSWCGVLLANQAMPKTFHLCQFLTDTGSNWTFHDQQGYQVLIVLFHNGHIVSSPSAKAFLMYGNTIALW